MNLYINNNMNIQYMQKCISKSVSEWLSVYEYVYVIMCLRASVYDYQNQYMCMSFVYENGYQYVYMSMGISMCK